MTRKHRWTDDPSELDSYNIITHLEAVLMNFGILKEYSDIQLTKDFDEKYRAQRLQPSSEDGELLE